MKKITIMLMALVFVSASIFATVSFTIGSGIGGLVDFSDGSECFLGTTAFAGFDFDLDNGLSFYNDIDFLSNLDNSCEQEYVLTDRTGVGYKFYVNKFSFAFGAGPEVKLNLTEDVDRGEYDPKYNKEFRLGIDTRFKMTYCFSDKFGASFQVNPSCEFFTFGEAAGNPVISFNAFIGCSYKF